MEANRIALLIVEGAAKEAEEKWRNNTEGVRLCRQKTEGEEGGTEGCMQ